MQMTVLLNNFEHANELLEGKNGHAEKLGAINYYEDKELIEWADKFELEKILGIRTFWDLQQNQEIHQGRFHFLRRFHEAFQDPRAGEVQLRLRRGRRAGPPGAG